MGIEAVFGLDKSWQQRYDSVSLLKVMFVPGSIAANFYGLGRKVAWPAYRSGDNSLANMTLAVTTLAGFALESVRLFGYYKLAETALKHL